MASTPIKLGSAAGTALVFQTGSKITTSSSGIQSCSITALYGDGQNIFSVLPLAGATYNSVFGNNYLPANFKVDTEGGGFDISYIDGKAASVTINFKRPDPTQEPGPNGQRSRKVKVSSEIKYQNLVQSAVIGYAAGSAFAQSVGGTQDDSNLRYGFPDPVVTVTYNQDARPTISQMTRSLYIQGADIRATDFPDTPTLSTPVSLPAPKGATVAYVGANGDVVTEVTTQNMTYTVSVLFGPNPLGWKLTGFNWEPHADESFFDVTETWRNFYSVKGSNFGGKIPGYP